jgi:hypothetical protein
MSRSPSNISGGFAAASNDSGLPQACGPHNDDDSILVFLND